MADWFFGGLDFHFWLWGGANVPSVVGRFLSVLKPIVGHPTPTKTPFSARGISFFPFRVSIGIS